MSALPVFRLSSADAQKRLRLTDAPVEVNLADKYQPRSLSEVFGQGCAVDQIQTWLDHPGTHVFLFTGPPGVGKTTVGKIIARELGCGSDPNECKGFENVLSGTQDAETVTSVLDDLRYSPMGNETGWRVVLVDEADLATPKAKQIWVSALETLPLRRVIIFTTNNPEKLEPRFHERAERIDFESSGLTLLHDAQLLANRVWQGELGRTDAPDVRQLKGLVDSDGRLSFRRVIRALEPLIRAARPVAQAPEPKPVAQVSETFEQRRERLARMTIKR